jgi:hypothetical protein
MANNGQQPTSITFFHYALATPWLEENTPFWTCGRKKEWKLVNKIEQDDYQIKQPLSEMVKLPRNL